VAFVLFAWTPNQEVPSGPVVNLADVFVQLDVADGEFAIRHERRLNDLRSPIM
jgi:hypothetical protein